jgi:biotin transport system substrate-specific component
MGSTFMQSNGRAALAETLAPSGTARIVTNLLLVIAGSVLLAISAKVKVPFYPVPMTLQTFAVMTIAAAYGSRLAVATVLVYLAQGAVGLPVFTNTPPQIANLAYFFGPTGGFLLAFVVGAAIVGLAADRGDGRSPVKLFVSMVIADIVIFALGLIWLGAALPKLGYSVKLLEAGLYPFLLGDLLKIILAAAIVPAGWSLLASRR